MSWFASYSERSHCTLASQYHTGQHLYRLELIDVDSTTKWKILSRIVRKFQKLKDCLALALYLHCLKYFHCVYGHPGIAFSIPKVSIGISVEQYQSTIAFHNHFMKANDSILHFKDQLHVIIFYTHFINNNYAKTETSCYTIQNVELSVALVHTNDLL